jgi:hypothetical protein
MRWRGRAGCLAAMQLLTTLLPVRKDMAGHFPGCVLSPFYIEAPTIAEEGTPKLVPYIYNNAKRLRLLIVRFADARNATEDHRKVKRNRPFVEALRT